MANTKIEKKVSGSHDDNIRTLKYKAFSIDSSIPDSTDHWNRVLDFYDKNSLELGAIYFFNSNYDSTNLTNRTGVQLEAVRIVNNNRIMNNLRLCIDSNGNKSISVSDPAIWRTALNCINKAGDTGISGDLEFANSGNSLRSIVFTAGANDKGRIAFGATAENAGYLEIATTDDGTEPIYVRQYAGNGYFGTIARTLTLLDSAGNTGIPNKMYWTATSNPGGVKDAIHFIGSKQDYSMIRFIDNNTDVNGNGISIGGGGMTLIGGGESATAIENGSGYTGGDERLVLANDNVIEFVTNCQNGWASATKTNINANGVFSGKSAYLQAPGSVGIHTDVNGNFVAATEAANTSWNYYKSNGSTPWLSLNNNSGILTSYAKFWSKVTGINSASAAPSSSGWYRGFAVVDNDNEERAYLTFINLASGLQGAQIETCRFLNGTRYYNNIQLSIDGSGNPEITVTSPSKWRKAIELTYKPNDVWSVNVTNDYHYCCPGFVSAGGSTVWFSLHTDKSMENITTITIQTMTGSVRSITQYIGAGNSNLLTDAAFTNWTAVKISNYTFTLKANLKNTYANNNTPLTLSLMNFSFKFT